MTEELSEFNCVPCRGGEPPLDLQEINSLLPAVPEWEVSEVLGVPKLVRKFKLKDFAQALEFTQQVGKIAEAEDHHPAILTEWGKVTVSWWTHKIKGLHRNDFIMAAKTDRLYQFRTD